MTSKAATVAEYLAEMPDDRRIEVQTVLDALRQAMPEGFEEGMQYGMIGFYVPHSRYPAGYHCDKKQPLPFVHLANQKQQMSLYLFCLYANPGAMGRLVAEAEAEGKKLDAGKSCVRFKKAEKLPLEAICRMISSISVEGFISHYEAAIKK